MPAYNIALIKFYKSSKWLRVRELKIAKQRGICERCGKSGTEVHHKIYLTPTNADNPDIAISLNNLELLCKACHNAEHDRASKQVRKGLFFDKFGNLIPTNPPYRNEKNVTEKTEAPRS